jgi:hypothetical protein
VEGVIIDSNLLASIFMVTGSISQKIGLIPFHVNTWGVAGKVKGVVITSPERRKLWQATINAIVPLLKIET